MLLSYSVEACCWLQSGDWASADDDIVNNEVCRLIDGPMTSYARFTGLSVSDQPLSYVAFRVRSFRRTMPHCEPLSWQADVDRVFFVINPFHFIATFHHRSSYH